MFYFDGGNDWIKTGNNIGYNAGNVGIGNINPQQKSHVDGNALINGTMISYFISTTANINGRDNINATNNITLGSFNKPVASNTYNRLKLKINNQLGNISHSPGTANGVALNFVTNSDQGAEISSDFLRVVPDGYLYNSPSYVIILETARAVSGDFFSQMLLFRNNFKLVRRRYEPFVDEVVFDLNITDKVLNMYGSIDCYGTIYGNSISTPGINLNTNGAIVFGGGGCGRMWCGETNHGIFIYQAKGTPTNGNPGDELEIKLFGRIRARVRGSGGVFLNPGSTSWSSLSDRRVKDNIKTIQDGYDTIKRMRPVEHSYKNTLERKSFGFIAQEILEIKPDLISISYTGDEKFIPFLNDDKKVLSYENEFIIPNLVSAIKTLICKVEALEEKIKINQS